MAWKGSIVLRFDGVYLIVLPGLGQKRDTASHRLCTRFPFQEIVKRQQPSSKTEPVPKADMAMIEGAG
jgi:hypothetical protein